MFNKLKSNKGSLTVESSICISCLLFFILILMSYLAGLYTESIVEECLLESSQRLQAELPLLKAFDELSIIEESLFRAHVEKNFKASIRKRTAEIAFFNMGNRTLHINASKSKYQSEIDGQMKLSIGIDWSFFFFESYKVSIERTLYCQKPPAFFKINHESTEEEKSVFLADHPSVYHTNPSCRSLKNRHKNQVQLKNLNNAYRECKFCERERLNE